MNVPAQVAKLCEHLSPAQQDTVLEFVERLLAQQIAAAWTVEHRWEIVARTMGSLRSTHTSSEAFAHRKQEDKAREERRWRR